MDKVAEIRWLTTWDNTARTNLARTLQLRDFQLARDPSRKISKEVAALTIAKESSRPIMWVDDDLRYAVQPGNILFFVCLALHRMCMDM